VTSATRDRALWRAAALAAALSVPVLAGCAVRHGASAADKAGGSAARLVLELGDADTSDGGDQPALTYFADQTETPSGGTLRVHVIYAPAGQERPDAEQQIGRMVRDGKLDLGWVGTEGLDELGVRSFDDLFAPFLVDSDALLNAVARSRLAEEMLTRLRSVGIVGLALVPGSLRAPAGTKHPLLSPADFAGARVAVQPSKVTDAALRALGARPVHTSAPGILSAVATGRVDGQLPPVDRLPVADVVGGNVTLLPQLYTLLASPASLEALTRDQRLALRAAAARTVAHIVATRPSAQASLERFCSIGRGASPNGGGRVVLATRPELSALVRATRPVYSELERDPRTKSLIERIQAVKRSLPPATALRLPPGCSTPLQPAGAGGRTAQPPSALDGTYRWLLTRTRALAFGPPATRAGNLADAGTVVTITLRDGKWQFDGPDLGTYRITGNRISFTWPAVNSVLTFAFSRDGDGTLHLTPAPSVEWGDRFVWSSEPWRRIGPPVRSFP
jgi:TRAP-type transport system periplasmic protein